MGHELLELQLIGHALAGGGEVLAAALGPIDVELAFRLLGYHRQTAAGRPSRHRGGHEPKQMSRAELQAVLERKLAMVERSLPGKGTTEPAT